MGDRGDMDLQGCDDPPRLTWTASDDQTSPVANSLRHAWLDYCLSAPESAATSAVEALRRGDDAHKDLRAARLRVRSLRLDCKRISKQLIQAQRNGEATELTLGTISENLAAANMTVHTLEIQCDKLKQQATLVHWNRVRERQTLEQELKRRRCFDREHLAGLPGPFSEAPAFMSSSSQTSSWDTAEVISDDDDSVISEGSSFSSDSEPSLFASTNDMPNSGSDCSAVSTEANTSGPVVDEWIQFCTDWE